MDAISIIPENEDVFFNLMITRSSPIPPKGVELGVLEVCHLHSPPGELHPEQASYFCSMIWGVLGECLVKVDGSLYTVRAGDFLLIGPGGNISSEAKGDKNKILYLLLDGSQAQNIIQEAGLWTGVFPYTRSPIIWLEKIAQGLDDVKTQHNLASIAHSLLLSVYQDAEQHAPNLMVWRACCYLQKNWNKPLMNVEMLLAHLKVSRSTLSPPFKKITQMTILDYLMDIRYRNATRILKDGRTSISQTALQCGFVDPSWFSTWYRKRSGVSPRSVS